MESYEASRAVFTRVQNIDPENASKIMGFILLHHEKNDMIHLAYGPETLLISLVNRAKTHLGLSSNTLSASPVNPICNPTSISIPDPLSISPRLSNGFNPSSPSSPSIWSPYYNSSSPTNNNNSSSLFDEYYLKDKNLGPFLNDPPGKNTDFSDPLSYLDNNITHNGGTNGNNSNFDHRKSSSFNDNLSYFGDNSGGFDGFCDDSCVGGGHFGNSSCSYDGGAATFAQCQEDIILRSKIAQHRLAAQLMASGGVNLPYNKLNFLHSEAQRSAAALMMSDDYHKLSRVRMARNELLGLDCNPSSRQIYLTFPADSTFREEDVSGYFNKFGPVQDVRIPYQQKRMFGFVTFVFPETVKIILAKGNPHFVCDSRVLVKPYKEKGKLPDKKQFQHQFERGEFSCSSPSELDCREPYDFPIGGRMMCSTQDMFIRKKLEEQAELQHALELQETRLMNLQLLNLKNKQHQHKLSIESPVPSPNTTSQVSSYQTNLSPFDGISQDDTEENKASPTEDDAERVAEGVHTYLSDNNTNDPKKEDCSPKCEEDELFPSLDHTLPDNLFASPTKPSLSPAPAEPDNNAAAPVSTAPPTSSFFETPRALEM